MGFKELYSVDCSKSIEKKSNGSTSLSYLSWVFALKEIKLKCPDMTYEIERFTDPQTGAVLPYTYDDKTGYMVFTKVTIEGITHEMWLPVMDSANKAMKKEPYKYSVKNPKFRYAKQSEKDGKYYDSYGNEQTEFIEKYCAAADMFDINKTIMRCLTKNFAMFGLGLSIYAGEDVPEDLTADEPITASDVKILKSMLKPNQVDWVLKQCGVASLEGLTKGQYTEIQRSLHQKDDGNASK